MALIRYPGSKAKLVDSITRFFPCEYQFGLLGHKATTYCEPFFGSGAIGVKVMKESLSRKCHVWINDLDPGVAALWQAVHTKPNELCRRVQDFTPSVDAFYEFKRQDGSLTGCVTEDGFRKLALHRMSVSGFGVMSGGPIGGRNQNSSDYTVECRWAESRIKRNIAKLHRLFTKFTKIDITCMDFREVVTNCGEGAFIYLDPPYYEKGKQLYKHNMLDEDHADLADILRATPAKWALSYDDHPRIRELYSWANFHEINVTYSNAVCTTNKRPKNKEVVIIPAN
jgi:DNA adenine methylase